MLLAVILVVAAVEQELAGAGGAATLCCGIGPVEAAAATAAALAGSRVDAVVHVGIAGMRADAGLQLLDTVIGDEAVYEDRAARGGHPRLRPTPGCWLRPGGRCLRRPCAASARAPGSAATSGCAVEAMEGYAVLRAAELAGVPAIEVRVISNEITESDRARWRFDDAFATIDALTAGLVEEVRSVRELTFGFSPCPNDTFAFHALVHGLVAAPFAVRPVLLDIEELNRARAHGRARPLEAERSVRWPGSAIAIGCCEAARRWGTASGRWSSPRTGLSLAEAAAGPIAIPGRETTAFVLLRRAAATLGEVVELRYDRILGGGRGGRGRRRPDHPRESFHVRRPRTRARRGPRRVVARADRAAGAARGRSAPAPTSGRRSRAPRRRPSGSRSSTPSRIPPTAASGCARMRRS